MKLRILFYFFLIALQSAAQSTLSLEEAWRLSRENYPLSRQSELLKKSEEYSLSNISKAYFPQINLMGQASYQSEVTRLPISFPGMKAPEISKDQYRLYADFSQLLYDGGSSRLQKESSRNAYALESEKLEAELYNVKERVTQLYFSILLLDAQIKQLILLQKDLDTALSKAQVLLLNGVLLRSQLDLLKAERLKSSQKELELRFTRKAYLNMLSLFTGSNPKDDLSLIKPASIQPGTDNKRPELVLFERQKRLSEIQYEMLSLKTRPKVSLFLQSGYGRPALNMLDNDFEFYYIGGLRLSWNISSFYTLSKERSVLSFQRELTDLQKETFLFNSRLTITPLSYEQSKLKQMLKLDEEILSLRQSIRQTALVQLENGVIKTDDYLKELNAEDQARQNLLLHEIQLLLSQYNQSLTNGQL